LQSVSRRNWDGDVLIYKLHFKLLYNYVPTSPISGLYVVLADEFVTITRTVYVVAFEETDRWSNTCGC